LSDPERLLADLLSEGIRVSAPEGVLTFCGPDLPAIRRAREVIANKGLEEELVSLLRPADPVADLLRAVDEGLLYLGIAEALFGKAAVREAKRSGRIVERCDGFLRRRTDENPGSGTPAAEKRRRGSR
jgi:hypothetical protein